jgi:hypothetical protein
MNAPLLPCMPPGIVAMACRFLDGTGSRPPGRPLGGLNMRHHGTIRAARAGPGPRRRFRAARRPLALHHAQCFEQLADSLKRRSANCPDSGREPAKPFGCHADTSWFTFRRGRGLFQLAVYLGQF